MGNNGMRGLFFFPLFPRKFARGRAQTVLGSQNYDAAALFTFKGGRVEILGGHGGVNR